MPVITASAAPVFEMPNVVFTGLAAPSRGSKENCAWRTSVKPGVSPDLHSFDHEEIIVAISGRGVAMLDGVRHEIAAGDAIVVPAHTSFGMGNPHDEPFEVIAVLPVGATARMADGTELVPPMAR